MCKEVEKADVPVSEEKNVKTVVVDYKTVLRIGAVAIAYILGRRNGRIKCIKENAGLARKYYRKGYDRGYSDGATDVMFGLLDALTKKGDTK